MNDPAPLATAPTPTQAADKVRDYLREVHGTLENAGFMLELLKPLSSPAVVEPLNRTHAANALNALQWGLYCLAAMDLCKVLDSNPKSVTLVQVVSLLRDAPVVQELRSRAVTPPSRSSSIRHVPPEVEADIQDMLRDEHLREVGDRFDKAVNDGLAEFDALLANEAVQRLRAARNKIIAHGDAHWDSEANVYRTAGPEQFKLLWGDPETAITAAAKLTEMWLEGLCCEGHSAAETRAIFAEYSEEFWDHLMEGLRLTQGPRSQDGDSEHTEP
ncbi:MAG: hypothetical protein ABI859_03570 [Pseudomonadota bacterium]